MVLKKGSFSGSKEGKKVWWLLSCVMHSKEGNRCGVMLSVSADNVFV